MMENGIPEDVSNSPVCGIVLIVDRMYLKKKKNPSVRLPIRTEMQINEPGIA